MTGTGDASRRSYDTGASQQVQGDLHGITGRLEALIGERDKAVKTAMSDFQADGVSEQYAGVEQRWNTAAGEVKGILHLVRTTLGKNDETATTTQARAKSAVDNIG